MKKSERDPGGKRTVIRVTDGVASAATPFLGQQPISDELHTRKASKAARRDRRRRFRQMIDSLTELVLTCTPVGAAKYFSPQWLSYTGVPATEQTGSKWLQQVHAEDCASLSNSWRQALERSTSLQAEFRLRRHDGKYRWFIARAIPVRNRDGGIVRWFWSCTDVEDQRALASERDRLARLIDRAPAAIYSFRMDAQERTSYPLVSAGVREIYGMTAEELARDATLTERVIPAQDMLRLGRRIAISAKYLSPYHEEWRVLHPQKGLLWIEARSIPSREADGSTLWHGVIVDVTERKRAEEELRLSKARLQAAVTAGGIGTWIWEVAEDRVWWDDSMLAMWGREAHEVNGLRNEVAMSFINADDRARIERQLEGLPMQERDGVVFEYRTIRRDGALQWINAYGRSERDDAGRLVRLIGACQDVTARKRAEEARRQSQKIEALGTLAGGIAHDFNNILLAITGNTRLAMADLDPAHDAQRSLREIARASSRATSLVQRILAFSRQTEARRELIQLRPTIEEALRLLRSTLPAMIEIRTEMTSSVPSVNADSTQIHQVVMNLITNSAHAIGERSGVITVTLGAKELRSDGLTPLPGELEPGTYTVITINDTGCGIDPTTLERIFDPFFTTKPAGQGTGLGLSVVHGIVRGHQGAITVYSVPGEGTTFRLYFPAAGYGERLDHAPASEPLAGRGQRVMYVDDEEALVYLATRQLQRLGYSVTGFTDPGKAYRAFSGDPNDFDVIVTDVSMPGMSGFDFAREVLKLRADMPIVMTSGYVRQKDREAAAELHVRALIPKPQTIDELGHALEELFSAKH